MRVMVLSANYGAMDPPVVHIDQVGVDVSYHTFTEVNSPSRVNAMTPRLRARLPKCFGWDLCPGYDVYLWMDTTLALARPDSVSWWLDQLGMGDLAILAHPARKTIHEEAEFLRLKLARGSRYLTPRYVGEDLDGQLATIDADPSYSDTRLFASTVFCYHPTLAIRDAFRDWWYHISRFHTIDQLALPYVLATHSCRVQTIQEDLYHPSHMTFLGHRRG